MSKKLSAIICLLVCSCLGQAQSLTEVVINPYGEGSFPTGLTVCNGGLYFSAKDSSNGYEPWVSYGPATDSLLADVFTGSGNSFPQNFTADSNKLFFQANDSAHGQELWVSVNGTTQMVQDINPGTNPSLPQNLFVFNHKLYFSADDSIHGSELWVSDGTAGGTQLLKDINQQQGNAAASFPSGFTAYNGKLYFNANDGVHGYELWVTDGINTQLVQDIFPGNGNSNPQNLTVCNGKLFFSATDSINGTELWVYDGNSAQLVLDINTGYQSSAPQQLSVLNNKLIFQADDGISGPELWVSDGTQLGTLLLGDIYGGANGSYPQGFTLYNGKLIFQATDSLHGAELWSTDGTNAGTALLADINPGMNSSGPAYFTIYHGKLYFSASPDSVSGAQLFVTDGTSEGTAGLIFSGAPLNPLGTTNEFVAYGNYLVFSAFYDGGTGQQLWFFNDASAAVAQLNGKPLFSLYPNPCREQYAVSGFEAGETYSIRLTDLSGRILQQQQIQASTSIVQFIAPNVSAGVYLLQVQNGQNAATLRFVKN